MRMIQSKVCVLVICLQSLVSFFSTLFDFNYNFNFIIVALKHIKSLVYAFWETLSPILSSFVYEQ